MSRTKIRQKEQIANSESYVDGYASAHTQAVAEPAHPTESIQTDLNIIRTQLKQMKGLPAWYTAVGTGAADGYSLADLKTRLDNMEVFVGAGDGTDTTPDYANANIIVQNSSLETAIAALDAYAASQAAAVATLDVTAGAGMTESGSLQAGTLTFDVVGTAGEITALADSIKIADAFNKADFSSFTATSSSNFDFNASGAVTIDAGAASNFSTSAGDLALASAAVLNMDGATGVTIDAAAGGFSIDSAAGASNVTATGANLTLSTATSGDLVLESAGAMSFDDANLTSGPATLTSAAVSAWSTGVVEAGGTSSFTTTGIIQAINFLGDGYAANKAEINNIEAALGTGLIDAAGNYVPHVGTNYIDGNTDAYGDLIDLDNAIANLAANTTLQTAYDNGSGAVPDIQIDAGDSLEIYLGSGSSKFVVKATDDSPTMEVTNDIIKMYDGVDNSPVFVLADGYVLIDGYFAVTGNQFQVDTVITDADHWLISPALSTTVALKVEPSVSAALYNANLMEMYDGYNGGLVVSVDEDGDAYFAKTVQVDGLADLNGGVDIATNFKYTVSPTNGYFLKTDASGNGSWTQITDNDVATSFSGTNYLDGYTNVETSLLALDEAVANAAADVSALDVTAGAGMTESGSLQAGTLTFDVVGTAGEITALADSIKIADAFSKTDFSSFQATSSGGINFDATSSAISLDAGAASNFSTSAGDLALSAFANLNMDGATATLDTTGTMTLTSGADFTVDGAADGYFDFEGEMFLADVRSAATGGPNGSFRLSTSATDFSSTVRSLAGVSGSTELGIIDAINAVANGSGSSFEKGVYVIASSDSRLTGGGKILDLATADRGSFELTPVGDGYGANFRPARDLEVYVNGILMLADATQKTSGTAATDDYFLASDDLTKLNFAFALVAGDVVVVKNNRQKAGEDIDAGWNAVL